jgi:hypothetical protein
MDKIGIRTATEIYKRQDSEHSLNDVLDEIGMNKVSLWYYQTGKTVPSGLRLRDMALAGYDVHYILTGERK